MRYQYVLSPLFLAGLLAGLVTVAGSVHAGAPGSDGREMLITRCAGGPNAGMACSEDADCPNSKCTIEYLQVGQKTTFPAEVYVIVDDNVRKYDGSETIADVVAVTFLVQIKLQGETHFLAQTYQNLDSETLDALIDHPNNAPPPPGCDPLNPPSDPIDILTCNLRAGPAIADSAESNKLVREFRLNEAITDDPSITILDDLLWQGGDSEMADELRALLGTTGRPVVASTPKKVKKVKHSDHEVDGLSSVAFLKVKIRFVSE